MLYPFWTFTSGNVSVPEVPAPVRAGGTRKRKRVIIDDEIFEVTPEEEYLLLSQYIERIQRRQATLDKKIESTRRQLKLKRRVDSPKSQKKKHKQEVSYLESRLSEFIKEFKAEQSRLDRIRSIRYEMDDDEAISVIWGML